MSEPIPALVTAIIQETPTVKRFTLEPQGPFHFVAGQWLDLYLSVAGEVCVGGYSMTSSPTAADIELAVKSAQRHPVTLALHNQVKVGDVVSICGGQGTCVYTHEMGGPVVLLAGGIGVTPLMSILRFMAESATDIPAYLIFSADAPDEFAFQADIKQLCQQYAHMTCHLTLTQPHPTWQGPTGRINPELLLPTLSQTTLYYLCGPQAMLRDLAHLLTELGVNSERIRYERW